MVLALDILGLAVSLIGLNPSAFFKYKVSFFNLS